MRSPTAAGLVALMLATACGGAGRAAIGTTVSSRLAARTTASTAAPAIPTKYKNEYLQTASDLGAYARAIAAMPNYSKKPAGSRLGWAELLVANGNRQTALLGTNTLTSVDQSLDAFKRLGVGGVVLGVKLPLLVPQYTSKAASYAQFFAKVAAAARARGLKVDVELGALFCGTVYAQCSYKYPPTVAGFAQLTAQQARTVIDEVHPDYLDLISEPNTEAALTGVKDLQTVSGFRSFVSGALKTIGTHGTTKLIAGAASWFSPAYDQAILGSGIDGLAVHIYPATAGTAANLVAVSRIAHDAHLPLIADEMWLFKGPATGGTVQSANEQGALNCFSFWQPLDIQFIQATRQWAAKSASPAMSGFWSWQDFAYSKWTATLDAQPATTILTQTDLAAVAALQAGTYTNAGLTLVGRK